MGVEEEAEPVEPETPELTLEEYMAQLSGPSDAAKASRKANDGENVLKGNVIQSTKIHQDPHGNRKFGGIEKTENKVVIDSKDLGFKSGTNQRGGERNYYPTVKTTTEAVTETVVEVAEVVEAVE